MHWLEDVRSRAREERQRFSSVSLLQELCDWIGRTYQIDVLPVNGSRFLEGSRGEVVPDEGCLYFDRRLENKPKELLEVVAHEFGHLILHHEYFGDRGRDLIRGSAFLETGSASLSRYSPRSQQEAEASAFAAEFVCPARDLFKEWSANPGITTAELSERYSATESLIQIQLAEGLYQFLLPESPLPDAPLHDDSPTQEQIQAALAFGIPVLVDAGPGTGKTKTLVHRVVHLVQHMSVDPQRILVLTFSNEAAKELHKRLQSALGLESARKIQISTFHGFGVVLLNLLGHHLGLPVDFTILDESRQEEIISEIFANADCDALLNLKDPDQTAAEVANEINFLKDRMIRPFQLRGEIESWRATEEQKGEYARAQSFLNLFEAYELEKPRLGAVDFADLIQQPHDLLLARGDLRDKVRETFPWVLVDEYQDVSRATAQFLQQICGKENPPWVVGDARQAIYRFRGAAPENVRMFESDFDKAVRFPLSENYRSCSEVISTLNHLAEWLENPNFSGVPRERWRRGRDILPFGVTSASFASANCDAAERDGIVETIKEWIVGGMRPDDIAVLARRNVDVRNIAIELKRRGLRAVTTGILTAEGAGGDLAAFLSLLDQPAALPRVAYSLEGGQTNSSCLDQAIGQVLAALKEESIPAWEGSEETKSLAERLWKLVGDVHGLFHTHDGWATLCDFLFFRTPYLRRFISNRESAESSVQLEEVLSALTLAAVHRFSHPHLRPRRSRKSFAKRLREMVTHAAPGLVAPRETPGAIRIMTCHASKGLQFPAVVVAGQSLPDIPPKKQMLPPSLRQDPDLDRAQADSLLFVGVSRAERAFRVCFADSASGKPRSKKRSIPRLLMNLKDSRILPGQNWNLLPEEQEPLSIAKLWGGNTPDELSTYSVVPSTCEIRTYLQEHLGARFEGHIKPLYPEFIQHTRRTLRRIIALAIDNQRRVTESEATLIADEIWPADLRKSHPHYVLYRPRLLRWASALARDFDPTQFRGATVPDEPVLWHDDEGSPHAIKLHLIAEIREISGEMVAIGLQVNSPGEKTDDIKWSELKDYQKLPFVLLHEREGEVDPKIFVGEQGKIRSFRWSHKKPRETNQKLVTETRELFSRIRAGQFDATIDDWGCDRCECRTICPAWIGASKIGEPSSQS
jgi:DNA helicase-2/ATP-dependent DNA helicase PcrA